MLKNFRSNVSIPKRLAVWFGVNVLTYFFLCAVLQRFEVLVILFSLGTALIIPLWIVSRNLVPDFFTAGFYAKPFSFAFLAVFLVSIPAFLLTYQRGRTECGCAVPRHNRLLAEFSTHQKNFQQLVDLGKLTESTSKNNSNYSQDEREITRGFTNEQLSEWNKLVSFLPKQFGERRIERKKFGDKFEYWFWRFRVGSFGNHYWKVFVYTEYDFSKAKHLFYNPTYKFFPLQGYWYLHTSLDG